MKRDKQEQKQSIRYNIIDYDKYREALHDTDIDPKPILDKDHGFEAPDSDWLINLLNDGIITLRKDSKKPKGYIGIYSDGVINNFSILNRLISSVEKVDGKNPIYYVKIGDDVIEFSQSEFGSLQKWREKLLSINRVLGARGKGVYTKFDQFILALTHRIDVVWKEELSEEEIVADVIMNEVYKLLLVDTEEQFFNNPTAARLNGNDVLEVKSSTLLSILDRKKVNYSLRAVREFLRPYMVCNTKQKRVCGKLTSIWFFKASSEEDEQNV